MAIGIAHLQKTGHQAQAAYLKAYALFLDKQFEQVLALPSPGQEDATLAFSHQMLRIWAWQGMKAFDKAEQALMALVASPLGQAQQAAFIVGDILSDSLARAPTFGLDSVLTTRFWSAVKTGTSKDMRDNWCVGFSRRFTVGVWVGNANGDPMWDVSGVTVLHWVRLPGESQKVWTTAFTSPSERALEWELFPMASCCTACFIRKADTFC
jgi:hypothetical protein